VKVRIDAATFELECERFALRFCCEDCAHFVPAGDEGISDESGQAGQCGHFWPTALHRRAHYERARLLGQALDIVFCKEFELL
jgi:hypothetical protein